MTDSFLFGGSVRKIIEGSIREQEVKENVMLDMFSAFISFSFMVIPVILIGFALRWLRFLHINMEKQTKQNEK